MASDYNIRRIKGDIAEAICKNHLSAMGLDVEFSGVENFARTFANRQREDNTEETNEGKIHNYIGLLPDILAGNTNYGYYFVEVKYRTNADISKLIKELLWQYRKVVFKEFDSDIFRSIARSAWDDPRSPEPELLERYYQDIEKNKISFSKIALPILFYILVKSGGIGKSTPSFTLYLLYFDKAEGKFYLHEAGHEPKKTEDLAFDNFMLAFNKRFFSTVVPVLNDLFSANIVPKASGKFIEEQTSYGAGTLVHLCYQVAKELKKPERRGVYFKQLLESEKVAIWLNERKLQLDRYSLKTELEREGLSTSRKEVLIGKEIISLHIKEYPQDFDLNI